MSTNPVTPKSTSLKELGYTIKPEKGKDARGNEFVFKVTGQVPVFYIKQTKKGRLVAVKSKDSDSESTIEGLYNFTVQGEGAAADLVGIRAPSQAKKAPQAA